MHELEQANGDPWLRDLSADVVAHLAAISSRRRLRDGELLYARGDAADSLYGVVRGRIRMSVSEPDGREVLLALFEPGSWFGEVSLFDGQPRPQDAHAVGDTEVMSLPRTRFLALLDQHPELYRAFARLLCRKLRMALDYIEDVLVLPLGARLAKRLLDLSRSYGVPDEHGVLIDLPLPQDDLARMLGASRQSVSKELKAWEAQGLIRVKYRRVLVLDPGRLQQQAQNMARAPGA